MRKLLLLLLVCALSSIAYPHDQMTVSYGHKIFSDQPYNGSKDLANTTILCVNAEFKHDVLVKSYAYFAVQRSNKTFNVKVNHSEFLYSLNMNAK